MQKCFLERKRSYLTEKGLFSRKAAAGKVSPLEGDKWRKLLASLPTATLRDLRDADRPAPGAAPPRAIDYSYGLILFKAPRAIQSAQGYSKRPRFGMPSSSFVPINDRTVAYRCPEHKQTTALKPPRPEVRMPRSTTGWCSTRWSVSFGSAAHPESHS